MCLQVFDPIEISGVSLLLSLYLKDRFFNSNSGKPKEVLFAHILIVTRRKCNSSNASAHFLKEKFTLVEFSNVSFFHFVRTREIYFSNLTDQFEETSFSHLVVVPRKKLHHMPRARVFWKINFEIFCTPLKMSNGSFSLFSYFRDFSF